MADQRTSLPGREREAGRSRAREKIGGWGKSVRPGLGEQAGQVQGEAWRGVGPVWGAVSPTMEVAGEISPSSVAHPSPLLHHLPGMTGLQ